MKTKKKQKEIRIYFDENEISFNTVGRFSIQALTKALSEVLNGIIQSGEVTITHKKEMKKDRRS